MCPHYCAFSLYNQPSWKFPLHSWPLLSHRQSHFFTYHCTNTGIARVTKDLRVVKSRGQPFVLILLDILPAGDTVNPSTIWSKPIPPLEKDNSLIPYLLFCRSHTALMTVIARMVLFSLETVCGRPHRTLTSPSLCPHNSLNSLLKDAQLPHHIYNHQLEVPQNPQMPMSSNESISCL